MLMLLLAALENTGVKVFRWLLLPSSWPWFLRVFVTSGAYCLLSFTMLLSTYGRWRFCHCIGGDGAFVGEQ